VTDDSAFKAQVRARMAETGEKYTEARRMIIAERELDQERRAAEAAQDAAIREAVQRAIERSVGLSSVEVNRFPDGVRVDIRAAKPIVIIDPYGPGPWREARADRLRAEVEELTGKPVQLNVWEAPVPPEEPGNEGSGPAG
jgi:ribosomal protein S3